jgi:hypothetical protein
VATKLVPIELVEEPDLRLRPVDESDERFKGIVESMKRDGFWESSPIEATGPEDGPYVIAGKGMHRRVAAARAGLKQVWVCLLDKALTQDELIERQIVDEATHVEARPAEFGRHLRLLQEKRKGITTADLARMVSRDVGFVNRALKLSDLDENLAQLVDDGEIRVGNALSICALQEALRKIDPKYVVPIEVIAKAKVETVEAFTNEVARLIEEARKGPRVRKEPAAKIRKTDDVVRELERCQKDASVSPSFVAALAWVLRKDAVSAAAEKLQPALTGAEAEGAQLRADCAKMRSLLEEYEVVKQAQEKRIAALERELERTCRIVEEKELVVKALEKGRRPEPMIQ